LKKQPSLLFCLLMDVIGYATYLIPFLGEFGDLVWAPLSAVLFYQAFGGKRGVVGGLFNFIEELLPFTDFVPTWTITWLLQFATQRGPVTKSSPQQRNTLYGKVNG
jgi:hypothetical protein